MTTISEIIFSGFVSKVVNDIVDVSKDKIRKAVRNKNTKHQSIESQIYNVIVDVLNIKTNNRYKNNQDSIYDVAAVLLKLFKENDEDKLESIKSCLRVLDSPADENDCLKFKVSLYEELSKEGYSELFRAILLLLLDQKNQYDYVVYEQLNRKLDEVNLKIDKVNQKLGDLSRDNNGTIILDKDVRFQNNKKQKYIENWNSRLFLHVDNKENPLTLADAFIMPDCSYRITLGKIKFSNKDTLGDFVYKFVKYERSSNMLITGVPGIGKSTITSWIANQYKDDEKCIILRFRDWESKELKRGLLKSICNTLKCKKQDLENKVLVIDGFDEMKALDIRERVLNAFLNDIKDFENFKCIITSRPAYIDSACFQNRIELLAFNVERIKRFYQKITNKELYKVMDIENLDVLGVPVILYMAIMSDIDITTSTSKPELYNRIFAETGGIFDRFCEYDNGSHILRNPENIKKYLSFLGDTAFKMFEKKDLQIQKSKCVIPELECQGKHVSILEFPIKHLFENTNPNIEFIHKSIYEYFVSEYVVMSIDMVIDTDSEKLAGVLGKMLKQNRLSKEIIEFLKYKIRNSELNNKFEIINDSFQLMLRDGMTYHANERYKKAHICERNIFVNMLEIMHLWKLDSWKVDDTICDYLKYNESNLNLEGADFRGVVLAGTCLYNANLQRANLSNSEFEESVNDFDLIETDLRGANLSGADLRGRHIEQANLDGATLSQAIFDENQIDFLQKKYNLAGTMVFIKKTGSVVSYQEYKKRSRKASRFLIEDDEFEFLNMPEEI